MAILAAAAPIVGALSGIASGAFGFMQGQYQAQVAKMNAKIAGANADRATTIAGINAEDNDFQTKALLGEQEAAQAASGISVAGPSQILTRRSSRMIGRRDSLNIIQAGQTEAYNYRTQEANFKAEAGADKMSGIASLVGGGLSAAGSLASSPSLVSDATPVYNPYRFAPKPIPKPSIYK